MKRLSAKLSVITLLVSTGVYAAPPKPARCPNPAIIYQSPFNLINARMEGVLWTVVGNLDNNYGTADHWYFMVTRIQAYTTDKAFEYARASLASLGNPSGPTYSPELNRWGCLYITAQGYYAYAVTPL